MPDVLSETDRPFLDRAIRLAMNGRGKVEPNPMVGCVIVQKRKIIGEGFHERFGGPHAEPNALASCTESTAGATAYVTLEPCCHTNKKTPPCVPALLGAGIARVVVGCVDPNPEVAGKGIAQLREAGVHVDEANDAACRQLIAPFIAAIVHHRPYITLKWAQTADGKVAGPGGCRLQISNKQSQRANHLLRSRSDAILIGIGTAITDDPLLTTRDVSSARPLLRIVLDSDLRLPVSSQLVRTIDRARLVIFCSKEAADQSGTRVALTAAGVEIHAASSTSPGRLNLRQVMEQIGKMNVMHLLVEPGPKLAASFLSSDLWDRAWVVCSNKRVNDVTAPNAPRLIQNFNAKIRLDGDVLLEYLNDRGVCAGPIASADHLSLQHHHVS